MSSKARHIPFSIYLRKFGKDERVEVVFYDMKYVSISEPILYIKTDGTNPIQVLKDAASNIITQCDEFTDVFSKAVNA